MKNTLLLVSTREHGGHAKFRQCVGNLRALGAPYLEHSGSTCITMARNVALSAAVKVLAERPALDVILLLDDDMIFEPAQAQYVATQARRNKRSTSAVYMTEQGQLAGKEYGDRWLVGLGFLAIPRDGLLRLAEVSPTFELKKVQISAFTSASFHDEEWWPEDYELCRRLGGVALAPVGVGHLKMLPIYPDADSLVELLAGEP